jgi:hypothetical protein
MRKSPKRRLLWVKWVDSQVRPRGWELVSDLPNPSLERVLCYSVGWVAAENRDMMTLVPNWCAPTHMDPQIQSGITIPRRAIISTRLLRTPEGP